MTIKKTIMLIVLILVVLPALICFLLFLQHVILPAPTYETNSIEDYGIYKGNYDNDTPSKFISSFFPAEIEDSFSNITYHYKAIKRDTYAYEAYLEFQITDPNAFYRYLDTVIGNAPVVEYEFNPEYREYTVTEPFVADIYVVCESDTRVAISGANIGKIFYCESQQKVVFWALGVYDGGATEVSNLNFFFSKFDIDPVEYAEKRGRITD